MDEVRLAMVGCGMMGQSVHLQCFLKAPNCEIVAICDQDAELAAKVAERYHVPASFGSIDELLRGAEFDAAAAIVMWPLNAAVAIPLLDAGKHVYIEKPIANSSAEGNRMADAASRNKVRLMVAYMKRYDPGVELAKKLLDQAVADAAMGALQYARFHQFDGEWTTGYNVPRIMSAEPAPHPPSWQGAPEFVREEDRDFFATDVAYMCHSVNLMRFLLGDPMGVRFVGLKDKRQCTPRRVTLFDYGKFDCLWETGHTVSPFFDEGGQIRFEKGWIRLAVHAPLRIGAPADVEVFRDGRLERHHPGWGWSFHREAEHFIDCVLNNTESKSSGRDSARDIALMEEIYKRTLTQS